MIVCARFAILVSVLLPSSLAVAQAAPDASLFGYRDARAELRAEEKFLSVPDAKQAGVELKNLTAEPHMAATNGDRRTADYVAQKFRAAGLETEIVPYRVLLNQPLVSRVEAFGTDGRVLMRGPRREHVDGDPFQDNPNVVMPFNGSSASGDVTAEAVYANYGRIEDFDQLAKQHVDLHGKIVLVRYGQNFRGVKVYIAQQRGAAGVLIYSDPQDDGYVKGDPYPQGAWRPDSGVQRGSVQYLFRYSGDPETPGVASTMDLPNSARSNPDGNQPSIPSIPLSYEDASPILKALKGPGAPQGWQGGLPFRYHLGPGGVRVHLVAKQDYQRRIIWNVIGTVKGTDFPDEWVIAGNHRDAWVYGAVDPSSGTAAMLEAVRGIGALLKTGWRPRRTLVFGSWDAEEEGLIGSTEWVEQRAAQLQHAVAYFNMDVAVSGPDFGAASVPSLKHFVREVTRSVPSPAGGTVYDAWLAGAKDKQEPQPALEKNHEPAVGDLGSGSDFTPFFQHAGVPSAEVGSSGPYGVYHSAFDNYAWFTQNADPHFLYLQQMARVFGLESLRMANCDVLPFDYAAYAREITSYLEVARKKAGAAKIDLNFAPALAAAERLAVVAQRVRVLQAGGQSDPTRLNRALRDTETAFLSADGLPNRPWYRHVIYAPGEYTGYAAVVLPGVNEALDAHDPERAGNQVLVLTRALEKAAEVLDSAR